VTCDFCDMTVGLAENFICGCEEPICPFCPRRHLADWLAGRGCAHCVLWETDTSGLDIWPFGPAPVDEHPVALPVLPDDLLAVQWPEAVLREAFGGLYSVAHSYDPSDYAWVRGILEQIGAPVVLTDWERGGDGGTMAYTPEPLLARAQAVAALGRLEKGFRLLTRLLRDGAADGGSGWTWR
jgi:hypothetical protein